MIHIAINRNFEHCTSETDEKHPRSETISFFVMPAHGLPPAGAGSELGSRG